MKQNCFKDQHLEEIKSPEAISLTLVNSLNSEQISFIVSKNKISEQFSREDCV